MSPTSSVSQLVSPPYRADSDGAASAFDQTPDQQERSQLEQREQQQQQTGPHQSRPRPCPRPLQQPPQPRPPPVSVQSSLAPSAAAGSATAMSMWPLCSFPPTPALTMPVVVPRYHPAARAVPALVRASLDRDRVSVLSTTAATGRTTTRTRTFAASASASSRTAGASAVTRHGGTQLRTAPAAAIGGARTASSNLACNSNNKQGHYNNSNNDMTNESAPTMTLNDATPAADLQSTASATQPPMLDSSAQRLADSPVDVVESPLFLAESGCLGSVPPHDYEHGYGYCSRLEDLSNHMQTHTYGHSGGHSHLHGGTGRSGGHSVTVTVRANSTNNNNNGSDAYVNHPSTNGSQNVTATLQSPDMSNLTANMNARSHMQHSFSHQAGIADGHSDDDGEGEELEMTALGGSDMGNLERGRGLPRS